MGFDEGMFKGLFVVGLSVTMMLADTSMAVGDSIGLLVRLWM